MWCRGGSAACFLSSSRRAPGGARCAETLAGAAAAASPDEARAPPAALQRPRPDGGPSVGPSAQRLAAADADPGRAPLREARSHHRLHRVLLPAFRVHLRPALAGATLPAQAAQLPERLPLPLPLLGLPADCPLLLLLQRLRGGQCAQPLRLLATLLLPRVPSVLHPDADELVFHAGDFQSQVKVFSRITQISGSSVCQVTAIGVTVILLYTSRACYNLFILSFSQSKNVHSFDYDWYNVSDQADLKNQLGDAGYVVFGVVLFVWELLPTTLVVYFFRVRNSTKDLTNPGMVPSHGFSPRSYFFDNPRRYDSDDDLAWNIAPQGLQGSFAPDYYDWGQPPNSFLAQVGTLQPDSILDPDKTSHG
ncbi:integral membrane protein GPR137B isoform X3 [Manis pentadactyla]|uniref:integral membrane protein GPR137B isoform X3 n=1 Tax=Manis pentadactyla TaxID=143292 RepID=UPI00187561D8|nr:integral membrane protein GPR137B isoform X3 [Manis pentadactyla]